MPSPIHPQTHIGTVGLSVADLDRSIRFYTAVIGLRLQGRENGSANLGANGSPLLRLSAKPGARRAARSAGLYHFALLVPTRPDLARALTRIAETRTPVQGFADHLVSEAIYLPDPDGHGIELYRDRPRETWRGADGQIAMATDPLDLDGLLAELDGAPAGDAYTLPPGTTIGHIHLHVDYLETARRFYADTLGFDPVASLPSALFASAGGYHHHLGLNTWAGVGAPPAPEDSARLEWYTIDLPDEAARESVLARLDAAGLATADHPAGVRVDDPAGNAVVLRVSPDTR